MGLDFLLRLLLVFFLVGVNAFFAGAEVALISVRNSRLRELAQEGQAGAQAALNLLANRERLLSVIQVGVTAASLGLGWAGEETVYRLMIAAFHPVLSPAESGLIQGLGLAFSFVVISYLHVVLGEVVPKNLAIDKADRLAVIVAPTLLLFYRVTVPFVVVIERSAAAISRAMGLRSAMEGGGHSAEELRLIVSSSRGRGFLPAEQEDLMHNVLDLDNLAVREVMVPRNDIISIPESADLDQVLHSMIEHQHSRLPVYEQAPERIIGILHYKDLLPLWQERRTAIRAGRAVRPFRVRQMMRPYLVVPETKPLLHMLEEFRKGRSHMAMVVDEFGTIAGLLTVEDVLEQIVGDIEDEYDEKLQLPEPEGGSIELDGATRIRDLETGYGIRIPTDAGFETLAGFLLYKLGHIPEPGASVTHNGLRLTVLEMERNRIARVRLEKMAGEVEA